MGELPVAQDVVPCTLSFLSRVRIFSQEKLFVDNYASFLSKHYFFHLLQSPPLSRVIVLLLVTPLIVASLLTPFQSLDSRRHEYFFRNYKHPHIDSGSPGAFQCVKFDGLRERSAFPDSYNVSDLNVPE